MARKSKKSAKKTAKTSKPARRTAAKAARTSSSRKSAPRKAAPRKTAKKAARKPAAGPTPVKIGRGPTPRQIGDAVVAHFNKGGPDKELWARYWHPKAESVEGEGMAMMWKGRKAITAKSDWWSQNNQVHSASAEGPFVGATGFSIKFRMDVEDKSSGKRTQMEEVGVYTIQNGKVVREEFMYGPSRVLSEGRTSSPAPMREEMPELEAVGV